MRALVLRCEPDSAAGRSPDAAEDGEGEISSVLLSLGCDVVRSRFDLSDLDLDEVTQRPVVIAIVDVGMAADRARFARRALAAVPSLAEVPTLAAIDRGLLSHADVLRGFGDFVVKPVAAAELYARVRQLDWRTSSFGGDEIVKVGALVIDVAGREARLSGRPLPLTPQEFELLRFLAQRRGRVFTRAQILSDVWGDDYQGGDRTVDIHVRRLRQKLGAIAGGLIETVRNVGYKMRGQDD